MNSLTQRQREEVADWLMDLALRTSKAMNKLEPKNRGVRSVLGFAEVLARELRGEGEGPNPADPVER